MKDKEKNGDKDGSKYCDVKKKYVFKPGLIDERC